MGSKYGAWRRGVFRRRYWKALVELFEGFVRTFGVLCKNFLRASGGIGGWVLMKKQSKREFYGLLYGVEQATEAE